VDERSTTQSQSASVFLVLDTHFQGSIIKLIALRDCRAFCAIKLSGVRQHWLPQQGNLATVTDWQMSADLVQQLLFSLASCPDIVIWSRSSK